MAGALAGEGALDTVVFASCEMMTSYIRCAQYQRMAEWIRATERFVERYGCPYLDANCRTHYGEVLFASGEWTRAEEELRAAIRLSENSLPAVQAKTLAKLAGLRMAQGRADEAERLLAGFEDHEATVPGFARIHLLRGEPTLATATVERRLEAIGENRLESALLLELLGEAETCQDQTDAAAKRHLALNLMARAFADSTFVGHDLSEEGIVTARAKAEALGLENASFEVSDAETLDDHDRYQLITAFDVIHDLAHPAEVLENTYRALEPGGTFLMVNPAASSHLHENFEHPMGPFLYAVSTMHYMTVSLAQRGVGLGTAWGEQSARRMLAEVGFSKVEVEQNDGDIFNSYLIATKGWRA